MKKWKKPLLTLTAAIGLSTAGFSLSAAATPLYEGYSDDAQSCYQKPSITKGSKRDANGWKNFLAKHHANLHEKLKLSASQESAWQTYIATSTKNITPTKNAGETDFNNMTSPDRMQKVIELMKERENRMQAQLTNLKTFYAALTPEQQKIFDAETAPKKWQWKKQNRWQKKPVAENNR